MHPTLQNPTTIGGSLLSTFRRDLRLWKSWLAAVPCSHAPDLLSAQHHVAALQARDPFLSLGLLFRLLLSCLACCGATATTSSCCSCLPHAAVLWCSGLYTRLCVLACPSLLCSTWPQHRFITFATSSPTPGLPGAARRRPRMSHMSVSVRYS